MHSPACGAGCAQAAPAPHRQLGAVPSSGLHPGPVSFGKRSSLSRLHLVLPEPLGLEPGRGAGLLWTSAAQPTEMMWCGCVPKPWCPVKGDRNAAHAAPAVSPPSFLMSEFLTVQATLGMGQNGHSRTEKLSRLFIPSVWH